MIEQLLHVTPVTEGGVSFLGEFPANGFMNGAALASAIGLTAGTAQHSNEPWLKFNLDGKTLYVNKKSYRHSISWDQINAVGAVFGTATVTINGLTYKVRLLKGAASDPIYGGGALHDPVQSWGSEWNRLMYPLVPNPTNKPSSGISGEGIIYGASANYTETELNLVSSSGTGRAIWCQESSGGSRVFRGSVGLSFFNLYTSSGVTTATGWRPVLELVE